MPSPTKLNTTMPSRAYGMMHEPRNLPPSPPSSGSVYHGVFPPPPPPLLIPPPVRMESFSQSPLKLGIMKSLLDFDLRHKPMNAASRERRRTTLLPSFLQSTIHGSPPGSPIHNDHHSPINNHHQRTYFK